MQAVTLWRLAAAHRFRRPPSLAPLSLWLPAVSVPALAATAGALSRRSHRFQLLVGSPPAAAVPPPAATARVWSRHRRLQPPAQGRLPTGGSPRTPRLRGCALASWLRWQAIRSRASPALRRRQRWQAILAAGGRLSRSSPIHIVRVRFRSLGTIATEEHGESAYEHLIESFQCACKHVTSGRASVCAWRAWEGGDCFALYVARLRRVAS